MNSSFSERSRGSVDRPTTPPDDDAAVAWGSDAIAEMLRRLDLPYIALNPGASYRGLHDSLVNLLGNERPEMVVCLHEEHAVAVAHGYAKVTERPLAVALHSNVGLMHASMALFNAFCDRVPMLVLGATGPVDAVERRPWIDWIHTAADQGALVRDFVRWDDQPASVGAAVESVVRGHLLTTTYPPAPVYICLDAGLQEAPLTEPPRLPDLQRHLPPAPPVASAAQIAETIDHLGRAHRPLLLVGRVGRSEHAWQQRVALAERLGAQVLTDLKVGAGFPTRHPLHPADPGTFLTPAGRALVRDADLLRQPRLGRPRRHAATGVRRRSRGGGRRALQLRPHPAPRVEQGPLRAPPGRPGGGGAPRCVRRGAPGGCARPGGRPERSCAGAPAGRGQRGRRHHDQRPGGRAGGGAGRQERMPRTAAARLARARTWTSRTRWTTSGRTAARGSGPVRAWRWAPRSPCATTSACPSRCSATGTCSWARARCGPPPTTGWGCSSWWRTTGRSSTTRSTRSASRARAGARSRTAGSASTSATPIPTSRRSPARWACRVTAPSPSAGCWTGSSARPPTRQRAARRCSSTCASTPAPAPPSGRSQAAATGAAG